LYRGISYHALYIGHKHSDSTANTFLQQAFAQQQPYYGCIMRRAQRSSLQKGLYSLIFYIFIIRQSLPCTRFLIYCSIVPFYLYLQLSFILLLSGVLDSYHEDKHEFASLAQYAYYAFSKPRANIHEASLLSPRKYRPRTDVRNSTTGIRWNTGHSFATMNSNAALTKYGRRVI
jgi:hypothetical protein